MLTGVTAGVGLGLNRAMLFLLDEEDRGLLRGVAAVGPADATESDRIRERLRRCIASEPFLLPEGRLYPATCSLGVASLGDAGAEAHALLAAADQALLRAKAHGKNRVEAALGPPRPREALGQPSS